MPKRGKKNTKSRSTGEPKRELRLKNVDQEYATIKKELGGGTFTSVCCDGKERRAITRGRWPRVKVDDFVLVSLREFETGKDKQNCDILHIYNPSEISILIRGEHFPLDFNDKENSTSQPAAEETGFDFGSI
jgi:initiation factor 1A